MSVLTGWDEGGGPEGPHSSLSTQEICPPTSDPPRRAVGQDMCRHCGDEGPCGWYLLLSVVLAVVPSPGGGSAWPCHEPEPVALTGEVGIQATPSRAFLRVCAGPRAGHVQRARRRHPCHPRAMGKDTWDMACSLAGGSLPLPPSTYCPQCHLHSHPTTSTPTIPAPNTTTITTTTVTT